MNKIENIFEYININNDYIVIKKPANMNLYGSEDEVLNKLVHKDYPLYLNHKEKFGVIYDVEKELEGIVLLSRNEEFHNKILKLIENKLFHIKYLGVVIGDKNNKHLKRRDVISLSDKNNNMEIFYEIENTYNMYNTISIYTHNHINYQINILLNSINAPLIGDKKYGGKEFPNLCLFIVEISFTYKDADLNFSLNSFYKHKINNYLMHLYF